MSTTKLTKTELRAQQGRLTLLKHYLPTLQLKKALLQAEVAAARLEITSLFEEYTQLKNSVDQSSAILSGHLPFDITLAVKVRELKKSFENIAGVEIPHFEELLFDPYEYSLFDTPAWIDGAIHQLRQLVIAQAKVRIAEDKKAALEKELREVSIRVNLFEKVLIPRAAHQIKTIKVFLGDQQLAAVSRAKVAKSKIEAARTQCV